MNRKDREQRLEEELRHHLEIEARDRQSGGLSPTEAKSAALRDLGNVALIQEATREVWGWTSLERLAQDVRYGLRMMRRSPGLTALAMGSLAIGIGANTTVYTLMRAVLRPPTGVPEAERVMNLHEFRSDGSRIGPVSYRDWLAFRDANTVFSSLCAWSEAQVALNTNAPSAQSRPWGATESTQSLMVTGGFFETLGLRPAAGHFFSGAEEAQAVAVVSHRFWRRHPESLGATIRINGHAFQVIGATPAGFTSPYAIFAPDLYVPLLRKEQVRPGSRYDDPGSSYLKMTGRLRPGLGRRQAEAALAPLPARAGDERGRRFTLSPLGEFPDDIRLPILGAAAFLFAIAGFILLIACANVGSLLLARASARRGEIGVRLALGAGRGRMVRQLVTESVLLFLPAALGGIGLCLAATAAVARFQAPIPVPIQLDLRMDYGVLLFSMALALAAGVLFGLAPAAQCLRRAVLPFLQETAIAGSSRLRNGFLVCEFSLAFVLVMALAMFVAAARRGGEVYPGKDPSRLYLVELDMSTLGYTEARRDAVFEGIAERVRGVAGVESAAYANTVPVGWEYSRSGMQSFDGSRHLNPDSNRIGPGYFRTVGIALLRGRDFTPADRGGASSVVIVNETMAKSQWPGEDPIGKRLRREHPPQTMEVVGVAADTRQSLWAGPTPLFVYMPAAESQPAMLILHVRLRGDARAALAAVRDIIRGVEPNIPVPSPHSLEERIRFLMLPHRLAAAVSGTFGALGILLAALGIYGVTAYTVAQRTREIGLRVALGAEPSRIWRMFSAEGTRLIAYALAIAVVVSMGIGRVLQDLLYGVPPLDPLMVLAAAAAFAGVWVGGIYLPARRAIAVDPSRALRWE